MKTIIQKKCANIEIDNSKKDVISLWLIDESLGGAYSQLIQIERENVAKLVACLNICNRIK